LVAELQLLTSLGITVHYMCSDNDSCDLDRTANVRRETGPEHFAILFHGGGNFGDLYPWEEKRA
jgi:exopolysaccharide biosynthesis predicted pyruvyltransferase EpsI